MWPRIGLFVAGQAAEQPLVGPRHPGGHEDEGQHLAVNGVHLSHLGQGVDVEVEALVAVFVASGCGHDECVGAEVSACKCGGHLEDALAGSASVGGVPGALGHHGGVEAVGGDDLRGDAEQLRALARGDFADGGEAVGVAGGPLLQRVLCLHVELAGHLVAVVGGEVLVEGLAVGADGAADAGSMGGEHGGRLRHVLLYVEEAHAGGPLVEMGYQPGRVLLEIDGECYDDFGGGHGKGARGGVVAVGVKRVDAEVLPHMAEDGVHLRHQRVVLHQYGDGASGDVPATDADGEAIGQIHLGGCGFEQRLTLDERRRRPLGRPHIRPYED